MHLPSYSPGYGPVTPSRREPTRRFARTSLVSRSAPVPAAGDLSRLPKCRLALVQVLPTDSVLIAVHRQSSVGQSRQVARATGEVEFQTRPPLFRHVLQRSRKSAPVRPPSKVRRKRDMARVVAGTIVLHDEPIHSHGETFVQRRYLPKASPRNLANRSTARSNRDTRSPRNP